LVQQFLLVLSVQGFLLVLLVLVFLLFQAFLLAQEFLGAQRGLLRQHKKQWGRRGKSLASPAVSVRK
jgi:hypothetical protein